ncbi:hypothetical protein [Moraxella marmotae]|uniref:hypothetical protein n=1 Tax=Moraxella marmotae TaxID=3344520 RepID=UPI0035D3FB8F
MTAYLAYKDSQMQKQLEDLHAYTNRLVDEHQPHATLRFYPFVPHFGYGTLEPSPVHILQVDDVEIFKPHDFLPKKYELILPFVDLNIPVGEHTVTVAFLHKQPSQITMNFEDGKQYVIKPGYKKGWYVYEYEYDARFAVNAEESVILKKMVCCSAD